MSLGVLGGLSRISPLCTCGHQGTFFAETIGRASIAGNKILDDPDHWGWLLSRLILSLSVSATCMPCMLRRWPRRRRWLTEEELGQVTTPLVGWRLERIDYGEVKLTGSSCLPDQCSVDEIFTT